MIGIQKRRTTVREIKFRAWQEAGKHAWQPACASYSDTWDDLSAFFRYNEDLILEQYTGLHDKNGEEIYEGDIVKALNGQIGPVYYDNKKGGFYMDDYYDSSADNPSMVFEEGFPEVIGNIHENPELLK